MGPPWKWRWKRTPPEMVVEEPPPPRSGHGRGPPWKWMWKRTLPGSGGGRGPAEKYCWASGRYALEKRLPCLPEKFVTFIFLVFSK